MPDDEEEATGTTTNTTAEMSAANSDNEITQRIQTTNCDTGQSGAPPGDGGQGDISSAAATSAPETISASELSSKRMARPQITTPSSGVSGTNGEQSNQHQQQQQQQQANQWLAQVAAQTHLEVRQRMSQAGGQLNLSIRQMYASASSIAAEMPPAYHNIPGIVPYGSQTRSIGPPPSYDDVINPYAPPPTYQSLYGQMREARKRSRGLLDLLSRLFIIMVSTIGCTILVAFMILIPFTMIIVGAAYIDECHIEHIPAFLLVGGLVWAAKSLLHCYSQCRQMPPPASSSRHYSSQLDLGELYASSSSSSSLPSPGGSLNSFAVEDNNVNELASVETPGAPSSGANTHQPTTRTSSTNQRHTRRRHTSTHHRRHSLEHDDGSSRRLKSSICESLLNCVLFGWFIAGCIIVFRNYEPDFDDANSPRYCHKTVYMYTFWLITSAISLLGLFIGCICCLMVSSAVASREGDVDSASDLA